MTLTHGERVAPAERTGVRCVDADVHPVPKRGQLIDYIPEPWRTKYMLDHTVGEQIYYDAHADAPDYAHAYAMRADTFPADGEFAGTDPGLAFRQRIMEAGADIAILEPLADGRHLREAQVLAGHQVQTVGVREEQYQGQHAAPGLSRG